MMKKIVGFTFALLFLGNIAFGQLDRFMPHMGGSYEIVTVRANRADTPALIPFYGVHLGTNYVLMHSNDQISLGVDPNVNFAISFWNVSGLRLLAQVPVFLMGRVGANSTKYNEQKIGLGAGIGVNYTYALDRASGLDHQYVAPAVLAELNLNLRGTTYMARVHWNLYPSEQIVGSQPYDFGNVGLILGYGF